MATYNGTEGNDVYTGTSGDDQIFGNGGNDVLDGGPGFDTIDGGEGIDTVSYASSATRVEARLSPTIGVLPPNSPFLPPDRLISIENLIGSSYADHLGGDAGANPLDGGAGDDFLVSFETATVFNTNSLRFTISDRGTEVDILIGGDGNDRLFAGLGDIVDGGTGVDTVFLDLRSASGPVVADLTMAFAGGTAGLANGQLANAEIIQSLVLPESDDILTIGDADREIRPAIPSIPGYGDPLYIGGIFGGGGNDAITGGSKSNVLRGDAGNDTLSGLGGDDYLVGGSGVDTLIGGDGNDVLIAGSFTFNGTVDSGYGPSNPGFDIAHITKHLDAEGGETLSGGAGDDLILATFGDKIDGGSGFDKLMLDYDGSTNGVQIDQEIYTSALTTISNIEYIVLKMSDHSDHVDLTPISGLSSFDDVGELSAVYGGDGDDYINVWNYGPLVYGEDGNDTLIGGQYNDFLYGGTGNDVLDGGAGDDFVDGGLGSDILVGGSGNDHLVCIGDAVMEGGDGDDLLEGSIYDSYQFASYVSASSGVRVDLAIQNRAQNTLGAGMDTLVRVEGLIGSAHNDSLFGDARYNIISGGAGNDTINGAAGDDVLLGEDGADTILGGMGNDSLSGGADNDLLDGYLGNDTLDGGLGIDTVTYASVGAVTVSLAQQAEYGFAGAQATGSAGFDTLTGIENLTGSNFNDRLTGSVANNVISGGLGNDVVDGGEGNDTLNGGAGDDTLDGGMGNDSLLGGLGNDFLIGGAGDDIVNGGDGIDTISYAAASGAISLNLFYATTQQTGGAGRDTVSLVENIVGSSFADTLSGNAAANRIDGGLGNDVLVGGLGNDVLLGGDGNDQLSGNGGADQLRGGAGADLFRFLALGDSTIAAAGQDTVLDFSHVEGDRLALGVIDAKTTTPGDNAFVLVSDFTGVAGQLTSVFDTLAGNYLVSGDVNGDGIADFGFRVFSDTALVSSDFVL